jgi:hypothetical protein
MNRLRVINRVIEHTGARTYLEIGVGRGIVFSRVRAPRKLGVDPRGAAPRIQKMVGNPACSYFQMSSSDFFREYDSLLGETRLDVAFVDGLHTYPQALEDVENCLKHLAPAGFIIMHDCCPPSATAATPAGSWKEAASLGLPGWNGAWTGDVWKAIVHLLATRDDLNIFVLACDLGVGVLTRGAPELKLDLTLEQLSVMGYEHLVRFQSQILNLKHPDYLEAFLRGYEPAPRAT